MQAQRRTRLSLPHPVPSLSNSVPSLPHRESSLPAVDTSLRFVRVTDRRPDGLVAFEFAIGWPELAVELLLPAAAFDDFCAANQVRRLDA